MHDRLPADNGVESSTAPPTRRAYHAPRAPEPIGTVAALTQNGVNCGSGFDGTGYSVDNC